MLVATAFTLVISPPTLFTFVMLAATVSNCCLQQKWCYPLSYHAPVQYYLKLDGALAATTIVTVALALPAVPEK